MNQVQWILPVSFKLRFQPDVLLKNAFPDEQQCILRVPPLHRRIFPDSLSNAIDREIVLLLKQGCPLVRPLFINVKGPALKWNCRREQHDRSQTRQAFYEHRSTVGGQMFGNLQRHGQVKNTAGVKRFRQVSGLKILLGNLQEFAVDIFPINS